MFDVIVEQLSPDRRYALVTWREETIGAELSFVSPALSPEEAKQTREDILRLVRAYPSQIRVEAFFDPTLALYFDVGGVTLLDYTLTRASFAPEGRYAVAAIVATGELSRQFDPSTFPEPLSIVRDPEGVYLGGTRIFSSIPSDQASVGSFQAQLIHALSTGFVSLGTLRSPGGKHRLRAQSVGGTYTLEGSYDSLFESVRAGTSLLVEAKILRPQRDRFNREV